MTDDFELLDNKIFPLSSDAEEQKQKRHAARRPTNRNRRPWYPRRGKRLSRR